MAENEIAAALVTLPEDQAKRVFTTVDGIKPILEQVAKHEQGWTTPDVTTEEGRAAIRSFAFRFTKSRTFLEGLGKREADAAKALPKIIDANRNLAKTTIEAIEERVRKPLTDWEAADKARKDKHTQTIAWMSSISAASLAGMPVGELREMLVSTEAISTAPGVCEEFAEEYAFAKNEAVPVIKAAIFAREEADAEQAELAQLRAEKEARDKADQEREAAAQRERDQQAAAARDAERIKNEAAEAEERGRRAAAEEYERKENERRAEERKAEATRQAEAAAAERKASNRRHQAAVNNRVALALGAHAGLDEETAKRVIVAVAQGKIADMSINY